MLFSWRTRSRSAAGLPRMSASADQIEHLPGRLGRRSGMHVVYVPSRVVLANRGNNQRDQPPAFSAQNLYTWQSLDPVWVLAATP